MVQVFIQPAYGTPEARRYGAETLDRTVAFAGYADLLDPADLARLRALHPGGRARFWGAKDKYDRRMDTVATGDIVLFTGRKHVQATAEVGHGFRNPAFARRLWRPPPGKCLFSNVYSLRHYRRVGLPYEAIWALPGFTTGDNFMGLRFLDESKSAAVIDLLRS
ncbi:hypothetical protein [Amycolatopsis australiensis]|uniref:Uncharacterized protein n=1 Tax=Amycolatopsis australiensis TaxID=546364 RepID=A0A1K1SE20_9PSEU|nr:hypothetical protein [Amycolatopsis australiensis]SFW82311.1 hypothetical protein SAMN04489730_5383 [Amycolatopsis australiensis]